MAEDYCGGDGGGAANWWDSATRSRFDGGGGGGGEGGSSSTSTTATVATGGGGYGWITEASTAVLDINTARSSLDTHQDPKMDPTGGSSLLVGLGLSSPPLDWGHQPILRNPEKGDNSFRSMLQEGMLGLNNTTFHQDFGSQLQWRDKFCSNEDSPELKQIGGGRGFSIEQQPHFSPSCNSMESTVTNHFQLDTSSSSSVYGSASSILQGISIGPDQQNQQQTGTPLNYQQNYYEQQQLSPSWAKVPQFLRTSPPKQQQQQQQQQQQNEHHQLQFTNNAPYWNAINNPDAKPNFLSSLQTQIPMPAFEEKPKSALEVKDTVKKSAGELNNKRGRNEAASSTLPPFKVRKEKMGDRITALQQLVSPFGKTDTASVLSEAIEYIKFLHEQVGVLSTPYLKNGAPFQQQQQQQGNEKAKMDPDAPKQDLRSRGLCLVPVSSTFPVAHETTVDFWTPTFGGTFR